MNIPIGCVALIEYGTNFIGIQCKKGRGVILPGGKYEPNKDKTYHHTACRELLEETGLIAKPEDLEYLWHGPDGLEHITFAFLVKKYEGKPIETDAGYSTQASWDALIDSKFGGWYAVLKEVYIQHRIL